MRFDQRRAGGGPRTRLVVLQRAPGWTSRCITATLSGVDVLISADVEGQPDERELRSLLDWLNREHPLPWRAELQPAEAAPGTMGALSDTLQVSLGAGGAGAVLAGALTAWIHSRPRRVQLRIRSASGAEFMLDAELRDPDAVVAMLGRVLDDV